VGAWRGDHIDAAIAIHRGWDQRPVFRVADDDAALAGALESRGFRRETPTAVMATATRALTDIAIPSVTTFTLWPPLAIQREIWAAGNIGPARQAVIERVAQPKTTILGRTSDRAAGAAFVAVHDRIAMVHCVEVLGAWRQRGLAGWMMRQAAFWADAQGASRLALAVSRPNMSAMALYRKLGFREVAGYGYFGPPSERADLIAAAMSPRSRVFRIRGRNNSPALASPARIARYTNRPTGSSSPIVSGKTQNTVASAPRVPESRTRRGAMCFAVLRLNLALRRVSNSATSSTNTTVRATDESWAAASSEPRPNQVR
jgi:GNAT superfamily N-acetyltransferase